MRQVILGIIVAGALLMPVAFAGETGMSYDDTGNPDSPAPHIALPGSGNTPRPLSTNTTPITPLGGGAQPQAGVPPREVQPGEETPQTDDNTSGSGVRRPLRGGLSQSGGGDGTQTEDELYVGRKAGDTPLDTLGQTPAATPPGVSGKLSKPAKKLSSQPAIPPTKKSAGAIVIPRENCGTYWTSLVESPDSAVNPCPKNCVRGERKAINSRKSGDTTQYEMNYQCYLPELVVNQPPGALKQSVAGAAPRKNCGTVWTGWVKDPNADVNPCSKGCERGELRAVNRSNLNGNLQYDLNYQCYVAQPASVRAPGTLKQPAKGTATIPPVTLKQPAKGTATKSTASSPSQTGTNQTAAGTTEPHPVSGTPQGARVDGGDIASSQSGIVGVPGARQINRPAAADRPISTKNIEGPGTTITAITDVTITSLTVKWKPVPGASGYVLQAVANGLNNSVTGPEVKQPANLPGELAAPLTGLATGVENTVWVVVNYPDGKRGTSDQKTVTMLPAENPKGFTATAIGPGAVRLEWQASPGAIHYFVEGSNLPRMQTADTAVAVSKLTTGTHEWTLIAVYPSGLFNDLNPSKASATVAPDVSGRARYRVTVNGFRVNAATNDDPLQRDGKGDEVKVSVVVDKYDRINKQHIRHDEVESPVFGDKNGFPDPGRVLAGSMSESGGLRSGDVYPGPNPAIRTRPPFSDDLPLLVWEGELESGKDALILLPVLWEWNGDRYDLDKWLADSKVAFEHNDFMKNDRINAQFLASRLVVLGGNIKQIWAHDGQDHPIGVVSEKDGLSTVMFHDVAVIALTREAIENELAARDAASGIVPGTLPVSFRDGIPRSGKGGDYTLYLQVERLP